MTRPYPGEIAAYHEAGHAVIAHMLGVRVRRVSINADGGGSAQLARLGRGERAILITLAGPYAQRRRAPHSHWRSRNHTGRRSDTDFDVATDMICNMYGKGKVAETYWRHMEARAEEMVGRYWRHIESVASVLLERKEITGDIRVAFPPVPPLNSRTPATRP
jgi:ATP-dependent Zn protease